MIIKALIAKFRQFYFPGPTIIYSYSLPGTERTLHASNVQLSIVPLAMSASFGWKRIFAATLY